MAADPLIYCLEQLTDYDQFERLCHDLMSQDGHRNIEPLGGSKDKGRDAIHVDASNGTVTIFACSVRATLTQSVVAFAEHSFHDLVISEVRLPSNASVVITVGWYEIEFFNVSRRASLSTAVGRAWLWHEISRESNGTCSCFTILDDGEFTIFFRDVGVVDMLKHKSVITPAAQIQPSPTRKNKRKRR